MTFKTSVPFFGACLAQHVLVPVPAVSLSPEIDVGSVDFLFSPQQALGDMDLIRNRESRTEKIIRMSDFYSERYCAA